MRRIQPTQYRFAAAYSLYFENNFKIYIIIFFVILCLRFKMRKFSYFQNYF